MKHCLVLLTAGLLLNSTCDRNPWSLTAVCYGRSDFPASEVYAGGAGLVTVPFAWMFYVLRWPGHIMLIDTGFTNQRLAGVFKIQLTSPLDILQDLGISPSEVTDILLTHGHFDHCGLLAAYPQARVFLHPEVLCRLKQHPPLPELKGWPEPETQLVLLSQSTNIYSFIRFEVWQGHSPGSGSVSLQKGSGRVILTGDEIYLRDNINRQSLSGSVYDPERARAALDYFSTEQQQGAAVFTQHDPDIVPSPAVSLQLLP